MCVRRNKVAVEGKAQAGQESDTFRELQTQLWENEEQMRGLFVVHWSIPAYVQDSEAHKKSFKQRHRKVSLIEGRGWIGKRVGDTLIEVSQWLF